MSFNLLTINFIDLRKLTLFIYGSMINCMHELVFSPAILKV
jgi:hypothetical protein